MVTAHSGFHPKSYVHRLYTQRINRGGGLMSIADVVRKEQIPLSQHVTSSTDKLM